MVKTGKKREPPKEHRFTSEKQPSGQAKKNGWKKKLAGQALAKALLALPFTDNKDGTMRKLIAEYFNIPEHQVTVEMMMLGRQVEKAIAKSDTKAFKAAYERAHGMPKQALDVTTDGQPILPITGIIIK